MQHLEAAKGLAKKATFPENPEQLTLGEITDKLFLSGDPLDGASAKVYIYYENGIKKVLKVNKVGEEITTPGLTAEITKRNLENEITCSVKMEKYSRYAT